MSDLPSSIKELAYQPNLSPFSELVLGLSSAALHYLGEIPYGQLEGSLESSLKTDEEAGSVPSQLPVNLELAKQNMEFIKILSEKTQGNLSSQESQILQGVINDLNIKYTALLYSKNQES
ncbi:MAG: DUF1844 domain-containing protein [Proteobacteria bacterium]|nr:DUF1844 domain-containing protein [Pseudomonadota bacterium]